MKIQALTTFALLLGTSTAALAAPHYGHGPVVREPERPVAHPIVREPARPIVEARPLVRNDIHPIVREPVRPIEREPARPIVVSRPFDRDHDRDHDRDRGYYHRPIVVMPAPVVVDVPTYVSAPTAFVNGAETINLGDATGGGIELNADGGRTFVQSALITYADGNTQTVNLGSELDYNNRALELQTDGSPVASVTIYGWGNGVAAFMV